jgi:GNAT superfamily N-acetyltransferase
LPGEHSYVYRQIDPVARSIRLEMTGASSLRVPIWIHGQELRLQKEMVYESAVLIAEGYQGEGLGRKIASNVYNMARGLDLSQITLDARMTGKYFWAKLGFLPDHGSWEFRLRDGIRAKLATLGGQVGDRRRRQIMHLLNDPAPETIRAIAGLRDRVTSTMLRTADGRPLQISLGMALLAEADVPWYGVLDLRDRASIEVFERKVRGET